tara:strand:- start:3448 stop:4230 length:783 start_codon:yes stop_codon:yes gene_type:complete
MKIKMFQVDAFTSELFSGNPAAVCLLNEWLSDELMLSIASENNLSETAFLNLSDDPIGIRWFSPLKEVGLCGHATLAASRVLFDHPDYQSKDQIIFKSGRGPLSARINDEMIFLDFPIDEPHVQEFSESEKLFGYESRAVFCGQDDYLFIFDDEKIITEIKPNFELLSQLDKRGAIISARSENYDFVSRCFFPNYGIDEDPVTGSAHTLLAPYWSLELNKKDLIAKQLSKRGGILHLTVNDDRVNIGGRTSVFLKGEIIL